MFSFPKYLPHSLLIEKKILTASNCKTEFPEITIKIVLLSSVGFGNKCLGDSINTIIFRMILQKVIDNFQGRCRYFVGRYYFNTAKGCIYTHFSHYHKICPVDVFLVNIIDQS